MAFKAVRNPSSRVYGDVMIVFSLLVNEYLGGSGWICMRRYGLKRLVSCFCSLGRKGIQGYREQPCGTASKILAVIVS